jgi:hypothetical protein
MNDAYNESKDQGQLAWLKQWSEVIAGKHSEGVTSVFTPPKENDSYLSSNH